MIGILIAGHQLAGSWADSQPLSGSESGERAFALSYLGY